MCVFTDLVAVTKCWSGKCFCDLLQTRAGQTFCQRIQSGSHFRQVQGSLEMRHVSSGSIRQLVRCFQFEEQTGSGQTTLLLPLCCCGQADLSTSLSKQKKVAAPQDCHFSVFFNRWPKKTSQALGLLTTAGTDGQATESQ